MSYTQRVIDRFGGLNLRADIETAPGQFALDGQDFDLDDGGVVRERDGFAQAWTSSGSSYRVLRDFPLTSAYRRVLAGTNQGELQVFDEGAGGTYTSVVAYAPPGAAALVTSLAPYSTPGNNGALLGYGDGRSCFQWDGNTTFTQTTPTIIDAINGGITTGAANTSPKAACIGVWAGENRVVYAGFQSATGGPNLLASSRDTVWISQPGLASTFRSDAFIQLSPGDGEQITAVVPWRDYVFIFKESKYFILTNTTSSAAGVPIFNFRTIDVGVGCVGSLAHAAGESALYFVGRLGIYATSGGDPRLISDLVSPLFTHRTAYGYTGPVIDLPFINEVCLACIDERLYLMFDTAVPENRMLVYDIRHDWWSLWAPYNGLCNTFCAGLRTRGEHRLVITHTPDTKGSGQGLAVQTPGISTDGSFKRQASFYRTGFIDVAGDSRARIRQVEAWGTDLHFFIAYTDFSPTQAVDIPFKVVNPANDRWMARTAFQGERVSVGHMNDPLSNSVGWKISRIVLHISNKRVVSAL